MLVEWALFASCMFVIPGVNLIKLLGAYLGA